MAGSTSNERPVFDQHTLRLIIGALAIAFPAMVFALTGKITNSISSSYHQVEARNVFVGFLFIMGGLLISYKGHRRIVPNDDGIKLWVLLRRYEEDWISTVGGIAAIVAALSPTICDDVCTFDTQAGIHAVAAFILFANVVYFSLIAFLRSLNQKLLKYDELKGSTVLKKKVDKIELLRKQADINPLRIFWRFLTSEISLFYQIFSEASRQYNEAHHWKRGNISITDRKNKIFDLCGAHRNKFMRGWVYVTCGAMITIVLVVLVVVGLLLPDLVLHSKITFVIETIALVFFGIAWTFASQVNYLRKPILYLKLQQRTRSMVPQPAN